MVTSDRLVAPRSRVLFGMGRVDITSPVGIYHRLWGAARHDRATGVHRPLHCDVLVVGPVDAGCAPMVRAQLDLPGLVQAQHHQLALALSEAANVLPDQVVITYSHTHAGGWFAPDRVELPGGELIGSYLRDVGAKMGDACAQALASMQEVTIECASGRCSMAANRDYWDASLGAYVCGFNPATPADETLIVGRITDSGGRLVGTVVNYACHPTTLAWDNTLVSPDYLGALREEIERETRAPSIFLLGACGDLGPRHGFVGDPAVADQNGRQVAFAALSILTGLGPPDTEFRYAGPVISGATLGIWQYLPSSQERLREATRFSGGTYSIDLPLKDRPDAAALRDEIDRFEAEAAALDNRGEHVRARNSGAYAERA
ncbi:MAG: hypothetical protein JWO42_4004, partial [Chloroflexi bacterium]|nr:hypothetical protein [Chloroflexota bacterium]